MSRFNPPVPDSAGSVARSLRRFGVLVLRGWCLLILLGATSFNAHAQVSKEYQIKAGFLYNFAKFVEWPVAKFAGDDSPLIIGVFGKNPFGTELEKTVQGRKINSHPVVVKQISTLQEAGAAHVLFIGAADDGRAAEIAVALKGAGVLTVGESNKFAAAGGMIIFVLEGDKFRFEISTDAADQAGLKISAQLLKLAKSVRGKK